MTNGTCNGTWGGISDPGDLGPVLCEVRQGHAEPCIILRRVVAIVIDDPRQLVPQQELPHFEVDPEALQSRGEGVIPASSSWV